VSSIDGEVASVDVVALHHHFENFGLVDCALLHEVDDFVLYGHSVVHIVVQLHLELVLELTCLLQELLIVDWISEILVIFSEETHLAIVGPRVEFITHGVLCPNAAVLATSKQVQFVNLLIEVLPVKNVGQPCEAVSAVEE
jgi:hypothetical protein